MDGISIIVPCYNEKEHVVENIKAVVSAMNGAALDFEVIVVDDGSTDGSKEVLKDPGLDITLVKSECRCGYGSSLKKGLHKAKFDYIGIIDADGTYPADMLPKLAEEASTGGYDMVVGARTKKGNKIPLLRRPAKWFVTKLACYLSSTEILDLNSGLRVMKKDIVNKYLNLLPDGFSFTSTITLAMLTNGYSVKYVSIDYFLRKGRSKIRPVHDMLNFLQLIIRTSLYFNPLRVFVPLSLFLALLAFTVLGVSYFFLGRIWDVTFGVILMTAVMVMTIGMLADMIDKRMG